ncbi:MAG: hypothetical protein IJ468_05290 [Lachnospiraceae bacterium]|nr:hypothetical protein [Lachnospiraceae bacterium]
MGINRILFAYNQDPGIMEGVCILLGSVIFPAALLFAHCCWQRKKKHQWEVETIMVRRLPWKWKSISYSLITGIGIKGAVNPKHFPICDKSGRQRAVVSLYKTKAEYLYTIFPDAKCSVPGYEEGSILQFYLNDENELNVLLEKTSVNVYITEDMYQLHQYELDKIFYKYPGHGFVSCRNRKGKNCEYYAGRIFVPYETLLEVCK